MTRTESILLRHVELSDSAIADVRIAGGKVAQISQSIGHSDADLVVEAAGGLLIPGLHDHHTHILALAVARTSLRCGQPDVCTFDELRTALQSFPGDDWIRGVAYHESVGGELTRQRLDEICPNRPVRIQHRTGKMWIVNSIALRMIGLKAEGNGHLFRLDEWLRSRLEPDPNLATKIQELSELLASYGITEITDATPTNDESTRAFLSEHLPCQTVRLMGSRALKEGERKLVLDEYHLPNFEDFCTQISSAHELRRAVAIHCVTRTEIVFALAALQQVGVLVGDRIEHASVVDEPTLVLLSELGVKVVTQPNFIYERGDQYLEDIESSQLTWLYRCSSLIDAGVDVAGGTDAPFGDPDPWLAIRAAVDRRTCSSTLLGPKECVTPEQSLSLFTQDAVNSRSRFESVFVGSVANLCLLKKPWRVARERLTHTDVRLTICTGQVTFSSHTV